MSNMTVQSDAIQADMTVLDEMVRRIVRDVLPLTRFSMGIRYSDEDKVLEQEAFDAFDAAERVYRFTVGYLGIGYENPEDWYYSSQE